MVKVYDLESKRVSTIPESELGPDMIHAEVVGIGDVWIRATQSRVNQGYFYAPFDDSMRNRIKTGIMEPLADVAPKTLEQWEHFFRCDLNAEQEIALWLVLAKRYTAFVKRHATLKKAQREEAFQLMLTCTTVPSRSAFLAVAKPELLNRAQVQAVIELFQGNWR